MYMVDRKTRRPGNKLFRGWLVPIWQMHAFQPIAGIWAASPNTVVFLVWPLRQRAVRKSRQASDTGMATPRAICILARVTRGRRG